MEEPRRTRGPIRSVRSRILLWVIVMAALGLGVTGGTMLAIMSSRIDSAADRSLEHEYQEIVQQAQGGLDPATGEPYSDVARLLVAGLEYRVPGPYQTYFTVLDGEPFGYSGGERPVALEDEPAALAAIRAVTPDDGVVVRDVETSVGAVRLAIVPVSVAGGDVTGHYVIAHAVGLEKATLGGMARLYAWLAAASLAMIGLVGWLVTGELVRPLSLLRAATARTTATDLTARIPVTGDDDVADLTRNYNAMLDRLRESFEAQRQLVDDVGHELRTPVTIARGYLELLDAGDPAGVEETRTLLLDETDRMGRLVGDLITLAKSGRPDFVVLEQAELEELTVEVFGKARALGGRDWVLDGTGDVALLVDPQRVTQAWLQLAENAVAYSSDGSTVRIGSAVESGEVRLWVVDQGIGIAATDLPRIFERFARGEDGTEGSGLGLTIAKAIAEAHGGRVEVESEPGAGSTFTLVLPLRSGAVAAPAAAPAAVPASAPGAPQAEVLA